MRRKILVTGGAGFIGSNLVDFINRSAPTWDVRVFDDFSSGLMSNLENAEAEIYSGTVLDLDSLKSAMADIDSVVHLAAIGSVPRSLGSPLETHQANATGTLHVLEAARILGIGHVVMASSSSVYGANPKSPREEKDWTRPVSPYGASKLAGEGYVNAYASSYGMKTVALRFFNVYGPRQRANSPYAAVIPIFLSGALLGSEIEIHGDGTQSRDFTYVSDVCEVLFKTCFSYFTHSHPINLAFGTNISINELVHTIDSLIDRKTKTRYIGGRQGDVHESQADIKLFSTLFPNLKPVPLTDGLATTIASLREGLSLGS